jgi:hypothetical protein
MACGRLVQVRWGDFFCYYDGRSSLLLSCCIFTGPCVVFLKVNIGSDMRKNISIHRASLICRILEIHDCNAMPVLILRFSYMPNFICFNHTKNKRGSSKCKISYKLQCICFRSKKIQQDLILKIKQSPPKKFLRV